MLLPTIANKKFLTKLVEEVISERTDPLEDPELPPWDREPVVQAAKTLAERHKDEFKKQMATLSAGANWVISTKPRVDIGALQQEGGAMVQNNPAVFVENADMNNLMTYLAGLKIDGNREQSVKNIYDGLNRFIQVVGDENILKYMESGADRGSEEYAEAFWNELGGESMGSGSGTLNKHLTKILNFRSGSKYWSDSFSEFYEKHLNEINSPVGNSVWATKEGWSPAVHYLVWKTAEENSFITGVSNIAMVLAIVASFGLSPYAVGAALAVRTLIFLAEFFLIDIALETVLNPVGHGFGSWTATVDVKYKEAGRPLQDLKEELTMREDSTITEDDIDRYHDSRLVIMKILQAYIADWISLAEKTGKKGVNAYLVEIEQALNQSHKITKIGMLSKEALIRKIDEDIKKYGMFFRKAKDEKTIILPIIQAAKIHMSQSARWWSEVPGKLKDIAQNQPLPDQPMAMRLGQHRRVGGESEPSNVPGGAPRLQKEIKGLDSAVGKLEIDIRIANILGRRNAAGMDYLTEYFLAGYNNWKSYNVDLDGALPTSELNGLWDSIRGSFSALQRQADSPADRNIKPNTMIHDVMTTGWCMYSSMLIHPLRRTNPNSGETIGKDLYERLSLGIIVASPAKAAVGSFFAPERGNQLNFMKMIKFGAIGLDPAGKIVGPEHNGAGVAMVADLCKEKATMMESVKRWKNEESYGRRAEFVDAYIDYYTQLSKILKKCVNGSLTGECGPKGLAKDLYKSFVFAKDWHDKVMG